MAHSYLQFRNTTENKAAYSLAPKGAIPDKPYKRKVTFFLGLSNQAQTFDLMPV